MIAEAEPDEGAPPLKVQFTASVEEEEGGPWSYAWDFGDGGKSTEQNPLHTYDKVGEYTATLTVTDQKSNKGTDEIDIFVETDDDGGGGEWRRQRVIVTGTPLRPAAPPTPAR